MVHILSAEEGYLHALQKVICGFSEYNACFANAMIYKIYKIHVILK